MAAIDPVPAPPADLCILIPVWRDYTWLIPVMVESINKYWPGHPPVFFVGLTPEEAGGFPHFPLSEPGEPRSWCSMTLDGVRQARAAGFERAYVITEDAIPLAPCHVGHLHGTLPGIMTAWNATFISLMGWDNRRHALRNPLLGEEHYRMMHLTAPRAPRFHLHPSLWRLDVLQRGCELTLATPGRNGTAWHFEKTCDKADADLPETWKRGCYQIAASRLSTRPLTAGRKFAVASERWIFNRLMGLIPLLPAGAAKAFMERAGFDDVYCDGPYPMFFSGVLSKGRINEYLARRLRKTADGRALIARIAADAAAAGYDFAK